MRSCEKLGGFHLSAEVKLVLAESSWVGGGVPRRSGSCKYEN